MNIGEINYFSRRFDYRGYSLILLWLLFHFFQPYSSRRFFFFFYRNEIQEINQWKRKIIIRRVILLLKALVMVLFRFSKQGKKIRSTEKKKKPCIRFQPRFSETSALCRGYHRHDARRVKLADNKLSNKFCSLPRTVYGCFRDELG